MTSNQQPAIRTDGGSIEDTVERAIEADTDIDTIVSELRDEPGVRDGVPEERLRRVIRTARQQSGTETGTALELSQPPSTDREPREQPPRRLDVRDLEYLSDTELARVVGTVLEWFEGGTVRPAENDDVVLDLYWNRQSKTVGLRTVSNAVGELVDHDIVEQVADGNHSLAGKRSPSGIYIVTNTGFTDAADERAEAGGIRLRSRAHLSRWFWRVRLPMGPLGTVLEEGENHDGKLQSLVELPERPDYATNIDPLSIELSSTISDSAGVSVGEGPDTAEVDVGEQQIPIEEEETPAGERGALYADPDRDGDYGALERFTDEIGDQDGESE